MITWQWCQMIKSINQSINQSSETEIVDTVYGMYELYKLQSVFFINCYLVYCTLYREVSLTVVQSYKKNAMCSII